MHVKGFNLAVLSIVSLELNDNISEFRLPLLMRHYVPLRFIGLGRREAIHLNMEHNVCTMHGNNWITPHKRASP